MTSFFDVSENDQVYLIFQSANRTVSRIKVVKALKDCLSSHGVNQSQIRDITLDSPGNETMTKQIIDLVPASLKSKWPFVFYNTHFIGNDVPQLQSWFEKPTPLTPPNSNLPLPGQTPANHLTDSPRLEAPSPTSPASPPLPENSSSAPAPSSSSPSKKASASSPATEVSSRSSSKDASPSSPTKQLSPASPTHEPKSSVSATSSSAVEAPVKRKRGRPPSAIPKPPKPAGPPAKRGRPPSAFKPPKQPSDDQVKRKRGRPPSANPTPKPTPPPGIVAKRGRPPTKSREQSSPAPPSNSTSKSQRINSQRQAVLKTKASTKAAVSKKLTPQETLEAEYEGKNLRGVRQCPECDMFYLKAHNACKSTDVKRQRI